MSGTEWIELLNLIPTDQHSQLNVMTRNGVELSIDVILRTERSFLVYRGRVIGSLDAGRVFFTPYSEITSLYLNRIVMEQEVIDIFEAVSPNASLLPGSQVLMDEDAAVVAPPPHPTSAPLLNPPGTTSSGLIPRAPLVTANPVRPPNAGNAAYPPANAKAPFIPPPAPTASGDTPQPKGSILDRLRAQRGGPRKSG